MATRRQRLAPLRSRAGAGRKRSQPFARLHPGRLVVDPIVRAHGCGQRDAFGAGSRHTRAPRRRDSAVPGSNGDGGGRMRRLMFPLVVLLLSLAAGGAAALEGQPKLGPDAVPITARTGYLRAAPAPDYWKLSAFYVPQVTSSACSPGERGHGGQLRPRPAGRGGDADRDPGGPARDGRQPDLDRPGRRRRRGRHLRGVRRGAGGEPRRATASRATRSR